MGDGAGEAEEEVEGDGVGSGLITSVVPLGEITIPGSSPASVTTVPPAVVRRVLSGSIVVTGVGEVRFTFTVGVGLVEILLRFGDGASDGAAIAAFASAKAC